MFQFLTNRLLKRKAPTVVADAVTKKRRLSSSIYKPLVWIDCEMTGLDISKDHIIEICCIITDGNLNIIDEKGYESTVYVPKKVLDNMNEWCVNQHGKSGLTAKVLANPQQTLAKVQGELLEYIQSYIPDQRTSLLAGNSVHMDKFFMMKEFPQVINHLHYRLVDVSSVMEIGFRHNPALMKLFPRKKGNHTARSDIVESINQLRWYRENYMRSDIPEGLAAPQDDEPQAKKAKIVATETKENVSEKESSDKAEGADTQTIEMGSIVAETTDAELTATPEEEENVAVEIVEVEEVEEVDIVDVKITEEGKPETTKQ